MLNIKKKKLCIAHKVIAIKPPNFFLWLVNKNIITEWSISRHDETYAIY